MAFPSGFAGYDTITPANPAGALTDFFYILNLNLLSSTWWANVKSDGGDVHVYNDATGDRLPVYLHNWNYGANTGLLFFKFTGTKSTSSESVRIYAGNASESQPAAGDAYGQYAVFPSTLRGLWPDGLGNDLTSYANHATSFGSPTVGGVAGPVSGSLATDLDGADDHGVCTASVPASNPCTILASGNHDNVTAQVYPLLVSNSGSGTPYYGQEWRGNIAGDPIRAIINTGSFVAAPSATGYTAGTWHRGAALFSTSTNRQGGINGTLGTAETSARTTSSVNQIILGAFKTTGAAGNLFNGKLAFAAIFAQALSADWIAYDSAMLAAGTQSGFYTAGGWTSAASGTTVDLSASPANATASAVDPSAVFGSTTATPGNANATGSAVDPAVVLGSLVLSAGAASATASVVDPTISGSSITVSPGAANATAAAVDPAVVLGSITAAPGFANATAAAVDPSVVLGSLTVAASFANATAGAAGPTVTLGSVTVAAGLADALAAAVGPAVGLGSIAIAAGVADATASAVGPSAVLGSIVIASGVANATASAVDPSIVIGSSEPVAVAYAIGFALGFVVSISVDEGTGGRWETGLAVPSLSRSLAASPQTREIAAVERIEAAAAGELPRGVSAPDLNRTDAEG